VILKPDKLPLVTLTDACAVIPPPPVIVIVGAVV